ncbi:GPW/gp25 family protein [Kribbella monticola]|uniref:GPW/gp25 family protein n=1 Tax=Kribbella monticola TaxID=2185285 RepID=UPI000DD2F710|nr:GPW/gp25 family protein [Kribbella monticola]
MSAEAVAGLRYPVDCAGRGDFTVVRGAEKLEQGMRLILQTYPGERVMRPDFGSRLRDFLFEAATPATRVLLAREVERAISAWEPRVEVLGVDVSTDDGVDGLLHIAIGYRVRGTATSRELVVDFGTDRYQPEGGQS